MNEAFGVRRTERGRDFTRKTQRVLDRQPSGPKFRSECFALDVLHDQIIKVFMTADVVERTDVGMPEPGDGTRFALEACPALRTVAQMRREDLQRDGAGEARVVRTIHLAHPTGAEEGVDAVSSDHRAGRQPLDGRGLVRADLRACGRCSLRRAGEGTCDSRCGGFEEARGRGLVA